MKIWRIVLIAALAFAILGVPQNASATLYSYRSTLNIYNLSASTANITMTFYYLNGTPVNPPFSDTVAGNSSKTFLTLAVPDGFDGSMVLASDQPVTAVSNIRGTLGAVISDATYIASSVGSNSVYIPLLQKNNGALLWNSWFNVQNVGSSTTTVSVQYSDYGTPVTASVAPGAAARFDQSTEGFHPLKFFGAVVTASQPLAVTVVNEHANAMYAYTGFAAPAVFPVMPTINYQPASNRGWRTGVMIQNSSGASTTVTVSYTPAPGQGTACTETQTIPAGASVNFALAAFGSTVAGENCVNGVTFVGSARVTANSTNAPLTTIVTQQRGLYIPTSYRTGGNNGIDPASATSKVVFPLIQDRNGAALNISGFNIMNVGASQTTVTCTFSGSAQTVNAVLNSGAVMNQVFNGFFNTLPYVGSGICTAVGGDAKIVGILNQSALNFPTQDRLMVYEGTNVP
jgi:hypothetical protein